MPSESPAARVAVVIPCYNAGRWIGTAIDSALSQDPAPEVIVVDDGSTDDSLAVLQGFGARIRWQTGPNRGGNHARNAGLAQVTAPFVVFLDADDFLEPGMLADSLAAAAAHDADIVLAPMRILRDDGTSDLMESYAGAVPPEDFFAGWLCGRYVNPSATLWRTAFIRGIGWDESLVRAQDADTMLRALLAGPRLCAHRGAAGVYRRENAGSVSRLASAPALDSRARVMEGLLGAMAGTPCAGHRGLVQAELYRIARDAFVARQPEIGRRALARLRADGFRGHPGTARHRLLAGLLGLERKVGLWGR